MTTTPQAGGSFLSIAQVAERTGYSQHTIRRWIAAGTLPAVRIGRRWRVDPVELRATLDASRPAPKERTA